MYQIDIGTTGLGPSNPAPALVALPRDRGWTWWLGTAITVAVLAAALWALAGVDFHRVVAMLPTTPAFWLVFALAYLTGPTGDFIIYRRLWRIPAAGFLALLRKLIGNELVTGYVGDLYFYTWARQRTAMTSAPFGAVKDVAILSAMAANAVTLLLLALAYPVLGTLRLDLDERAIFGSVAVVLAISSGVLLFRKKLFSLPAPDLRFIGGIHTARIFANLALIGLAWHLALPGMGVQWWLLLAAMRMLLSRLPLLPNKDVVFAGLAVFLIGHDDQLGTLMAMMASLMLVTHVALGLVLVGGEALGWRRR